MPYKGEDLDEIEHVRSLPLRGAAWAAGDICGVSTLDAAMTTKIVERVPSHEAGLEIVGMLLSARADVNRLDQQVACTPYFVCGRVCLEIFLDAKLPTR